MVTQDELNDILCMVHDYLIEYLSLDLAEDITDEIAITLQDKFNIDCNGDWYGY